MKGNLKGKKFFIECEFDNWTEMAENMLNNMVSNKMDVIPGLKARRIVDQTNINDGNSDISRDVVYVRNQIMQALDKLVNKYDNGQALKSVNTTNNYAKELSSINAAEAVRNTEKLLNNRNTK